MKKMSTRMVVEAGIMIALAQILSYFKLFEAPYGGSVTVGSMIPIVLFAIRWGVKPGILVGVVYGIFQYVFGTKYAPPVPTFINYAFVIALDYIFAFACLGLAGLFRKKYGYIILSTLIAILGRFTFHFISGVTIWGGFNSEGIVYSITYNGGYLLPEFIITAAILSALYKPLKRFLVQS